MTPNHHSLTTIRMQFLLTVCVHGETTVVLRSSFFPGVLPPGMASCQDITVLAEERRKCNAGLILHIPVEACHFHSNSFPEQFAQPHLSSLGGMHTSPTGRSNLGRGTEYQETVIQSTNIE